MFLFTITAIIHIFFCYQNLEQLRRLTKPLLIPLLIGYYWTSVSDANILVILALISAFFGDVLLLGKDKRCFVAGLTAFLLGHIIYLVLFSSDFNIEKLGLWLLVVFFYLIVGIVAYQSLSRGVGRLKIPIITYIAILETMSVFAFFSLWLNPSLGRLLVYIGTLLFCLSDYLLARRVFIQANARPHLMVMSTYLAAELLIVMGMV